jgi:hypothetical protein
MTALLVQSDMDQRSVIDQYWPGTEIHITSGKPPAAKFDKFAAGSFVASYWRAVRGQKRSASTQKRSIFERLLSLSVMTNRIMAQWQELVVERTAAFFCAENGHFQFERQFQRMIVGRRSKAVVTQIEKLFNAGTHARRCSLAIRAISANDMTHNSCHRLFQPT